MDNKKLPECLRGVYSNHSLKELTYINIRWRLCPFEKIESLLPLEGLIVDIGCGYGLLSNLIALKSERRHVLGIDLSETRIGAAKKSIKQRKNIEFLNQDIATFNFHTCDAVVMSDLLHHMPTCGKNKLIKKIYGNLRSDGSFIIQDVDTSPYWKYCFSYLNDLLQHKRNDLFYQPSNEIEKKLKETGFEVITTLAHKGYPVSDIIFVCKKTKSFINKKYGFI